MHVNQTRFSQGLLATAFVFMVSLSACVKNFDATFTNPCDVPLELMTRSAPADVVRERAGNPTAQATVPALGAVLVEDAFYDNLNSEWSVVVTHGDAEHVVEASGANLEANNGIIALPASVCES